MDMTIYGVEIWSATLVFARVGAMVMLLPGVGETAAPARARLGFALMLAVLLTPGLSPHIAPPPAGAWGLAGVILGELLIGLMLGAAARMMMTALATAGQVMGLEIGLAFAQTADPTMTQSGQILSVFLGLLGIALVFATGLHHLFLRGVAGSYELFSPGAPVPVADGAALAVDTVSTSFRVAFQIAAPVIAAGLIFRVGLGALARLIPTIQVFFVVIPLQLLGGFVVIGLGLSGGMLVWLDSMQRFGEGMAR